jgi:hypothetical protein
VAGARDFPGIGRFGGSVITGYQVKDFDATRMQGAAFRDGKPADARQLEGRITRIAYRTVGNDCTHFGNPAKRADGCSRSAFAILTMLSNPTLRSPRSIPPT